MPNWEKIRKEWENSDITFKALAEKHSIKDSTIRSRKNRERWQRNKRKTLQRKRSDIQTGIRAIKIRRINLPNGTK